jgi:hypothetical protein
MRRDRPGRLLRWVHELELRDGRHRLGERADVRHRLGDHGTDIVAAAKTVRLSYTGRRSCCELHTVAMGKAATVGRAPLGGAPSHHHYREVATNP